METMIDFFEFAKEVLNIDFLPYQKEIIKPIIKLNNKYGIGKWEILYGRKGNPRIYIKDKDKFVGEW